MPALVEVQERTGSAMLLTVTVGGHQLEVQAPATFRARSGETIDAETHLVLDPAA